MQPPTRSRRRWVAALFAVGLIAGVGWWWRDHAPHAALPPATDGSGGSSGEAGSTGDAALQAPSHLDVVTGFRSGPSRRERSVRPLGATAAEDYRRRARFPPDAMPLTDEEQDPIVRDREVSPVRGRGPEGAEPVLVVQPAAPTFEDPDPVVLFAHLERDGRPVPALELRATLATEEGVVLGDFEYRDDGTPPDVEAFDDVGTAVIVLPETARPELSASYLVRARAITLEGDERTAAMSFQYSRPWAQPTGRFADRLIAGSLWVGVEIEVRRAGRFHLEGTLYSTDGAHKIAWAQAAGEFAEGRHWIDLPFYGLALAERGIDGPYLLRWLALSTTGSMPNAKNRVLENAHLTGAYAADDFTDEPYDDPDLLEAARRVEEEGAVPALEAGG